MPITLTNPPGFADVPDSVLAAENYALGIVIGKLSDNAEFGQVRMEVFHGLYKHGDTVATPVSTIDKYPYSRTELMYIWVVRGSVSPSTGWITGPDCLYYCNWYVDQTTGAVTSEEWYRRSGDDDKTTKSNDGNILVFTVAQRQKDSMTIATIPYFTDIDDTVFVQDEPLKTGWLKQLNNNAKFACVNTECIYMGEFVNGDTVSKPVSPVDGYVYSYSECAFVPCWKWTTINTAYTQPPKSDGQLATLKCGVNASTGAVSVSVAMVTDGSVFGSSGLVTHTNYGRVVVFALCNREVNVAELTVLGTSIPWDPALNPGASFTTGLGFTAPSVAPLTMTPGASVTIERLSGLVDGNGSGNFYDGNGGPGMSGHSNFPSDWIVPYTLGLAAIVAAFTDDTGVIKGSPFQVGNGPVTKTVPAGASRLSIGVNDDDYGDPMVPGDNAGSFLVKVSIAGFTVYGTGDDFAEVNQSEFYPGSPLKNTDMLQVNRNARQGALSPEIFGPTTHSNGDTIALPVSAIDGYTYSRSELTYVWSWTDTTNQTGSHLRMPLFHGIIDDTTGVVTLNVWRLPPGGPIEDDDNALARITVIIVAERQKTSTSAAGGAINAPSDASTIPVDQPASGYFLFNGS